MSVAGHFQADYSAKCRDSRRVLSDNRKQSVSRLLYAALQTKEIILNLIKLALYKVCLLFGVGEVIKVCFWFS